MAEQKPEDYLTYFALLRGEKVALAPDVPHCGFYERRGKNGQRQPVYIYRDDSGVIVALAGTKDRAAVEDDAGRLGRLFSSICDRPISYETWNAVYETGRWPDDPVPTQSPPATAAQLTSSGADGSADVATSAQADPGTATVGPGKDQPPAGTGHNNPPTGTLAEISAAWADLRPEITRLLGAGVKSQADADRLGNFVQRVKDMLKRGDDSRLAETKPLRDKVSEINASWKTLLDAIDGAIEKMKKPLTEFMAAQKKKAQEEAALAIAQGADAADVAPAKAKAGGTNGGRSVRLVTQKSAKVVDWNLLLGHLKEHPEIRETAQRIASAAARSDITLPGCEIEKKEVAQT